MPFEGLHPPYEVIYCDPPWQYAVSQFRGKDGEVCRVEDHYPTMATDDICALPVRDIAAENAVLFMWVTNPFLPDGLRVGEAWGFKYATVAFVWEKFLTNPSYWTVSSCELCLAFKRGKFPQPRGARNVAQFLAKKRTAHSRKPADFHARIEALFPAQRRVELFARGGADGWDAWGNQANMPGLF